jgi:protein ImuA
VRSFTAPIPNPIQSLRDRISVSRAEARSIETGWGPGSPTLDRGCIHEWFAEACPAALFAGIAARSLGDRPGSILWIGCACWPYPAWLTPDLLRRSVFIDPACDAERAWAIDQALRCAGVSCVVADGRRIDMPTSRRLQLAAGTGGGGVLGLLARPPDEIRILSAARTRWRVTPAPNPHPHPDAHFHPTPRWTVELLRCKGLRPDTDARRWVVQLAHDTRHVSLVPDAADRGVQTPAPAAPGRRLA